MMEREALVVAFAAILPRAGATGRVEVQVDVISIRTDLSADEQTQALLQHAYTIYPPTDGWVAHSLEACKANKVAALITKAAEVQ